MVVEEFCIVDSEDEDNGPQLGVSVNIPSGLSEVSSQTRTNESSIQSFARTAHQYSTSISSFTGILAPETSFDIRTSQISASSRYLPGIVQPQQPLNLTTTKPKRPKPRPLNVRVPPTPQPEQSVPAPLAMTNIAKPKPRRPKPRPAILQSSRSPGPEASQSTRDIPPPMSSSNPPAPPTPDYANFLRNVSPLSDIGPFDSSPGPKKRKRVAVIDVSDDEDGSPTVPSLKRSEKGNVNPPSSNSDANAGGNQPTSGKRKGKKREKAKSNAETFPDTDGVADELNLSKDMEASTTKSAKKSKARKEKPAKGKKGKEASSQVTTEETGTNPDRGITTDASTAIPEPISTGSNTNVGKESTEVSRSVRGPAPPLRTHKSDSAALKDSRSSPWIEDPLKAYRIPARTKVTMSELLNRLPGYRPLAASTAAYKNSKRVLGKIASLHPTRKTPPPPPPRVVRVERKTKAMRDEEERWEEEWEEMYGEAWYEMSEEDKEKLRRERRDSLWVED